VEEIGAPSIDWLGVPLVFGDQTLGVFAVQTYTEGVRYGEREKDILTFVSRQVALAIGRKRAEEQLQRSEQDYRSVVENANEAIIISQEGVLQYVNPSTVALSGYSESDLLGKPLLGFVHADDRDMVLTNYKRRMQGFEVPTVYELRLTTKNCDVKWAKNSAVMVNWGGMPAVLHFLTDITERKLAEDALRESEQLVRSVLDAMADAVIITDPQGHALFVNPAAARIADLPSPEAAAGVSVLDFVCTDDREAALRDLALMSAGTQPSPGRYRQRTASGKERWIEALGTTIRFKKEPAYLLTVRDITERMHLEIQLRQAQKMEAVGRLAGGIAHDFNNVLQALLSLSQALPSQLTDPVRFGATSLELQEQVKRGAALTRQLLLFSRQEARRLERLDLKQVVRQFSQMMRLVRENVWVSLELGDGSIPVMGDRGQLEQVLMNLVVNAADAMPQGGRLTIRARTEGGNAILEVMDTGTGMTEETKARLFEPFFTTKDASRGTGLGLSVVHGIVTGHGGSVEAESQVNQGSTFRVVLPTTTNPEAEVEPGAVGDRARLAVGGGERVLVVEDETGAREGLQQVLTMLGYRVTAVGSGAEADALAPEPGFDLLLTDYLLPDVLGTDLAVRLQERWPAVKVVLMSGYAQDEAVRRRISQGELRFLQKPFDMATVARELRDALASHATLGTE
jgi:PAS domain S-box-containing protein